MEKSHRPHSGFMVQARFELLGGMAGCKQEREIKKLGCNFHGRDSFNVGIDGKVKTIWESGPI